MAEFLEFRGIFKTYGSVKAVDGVTLTIRKGEVYSLLGPSGCGKTTLLRILAGFAAPDSGRVVLDGVDLTDLPPNKRQVNTVFQNYALFPHLNIRENIAFGLRIARMPEKTVRHEVDRMLDLIDLKEHADKQIHEISGGQKQRVAIARALVNNPLVLLLDEPLAALDLKLRQRMLVELDAIHERVGTTFVYVTHDQGEAMTISDTIAVMNKGRVEQVGNPAEIYEAPRSSFVAAFIGDTTFFDGVIVQSLSGDYSRMRIPDLGDVTVFNDKHLKPGDAVHLSLRPEKLNITLDKPTPGSFYGGVLPFDGPPRTDDDPHGPAVKLNTFPGKVEEIIYLGSHTKYWVRVGEYRIGVHRQHRRFQLDERPIRWDDNVWVTWHADDGYMLERYSEADEQLLVLPDPEETPASEPAESAAASSAPPEG